jgi:DNA-binding transcriptional LysR family regulator
MTDIDAGRLRRLDLTLLLVFAALMRHRRLTLVAAQMGLTQSAISHSLRRLREVFDDPLFRRRPNGVEPTARALALEPVVAGIVALARRALQVESGFEPLRSDRVFALGALDYETSVMAGPLTLLLRREAPNTRLVVRGVARREALDLLADGRLDLAIGFFPDLPERFVRDPLYDEDYVVIARRGHPVARGRLTLARYVACQHLLVSIGGDFHGIVDRELATRGRSRRVVATVPMFLPALAIVAETDLIATVPRRLAGKHGRRFGLALLPPPLAIRRFAVSTVAHRRMADDPGQVWLRTRIRSLFAEGPTR